MSNETQPKRRRTQPTAPAEDGVRRSAMTRSTTARLRGSARRAESQRGESRGGAPARNARAGLVRATRSAGERRATDARVQRQPTARRSATPSRGRQERVVEAKESMRVPLLPAVAIWVVSIVLTAFVTRAVVMGDAGRTSEQATSSASSSVESTQEGDVVEASPTSATSRTSSSDDEPIIEEVDTDDATKRGTSRMSSENTSSSEDEENGTSKANKGVKSPWTSTGMYSSGDATLDEEVKKFCDGIATTDMSIDTAALEVYKGVAWADYVERDEAQHPAGKDWRYVYAHQYYENGCSGNCYEFAAFLSFCLQYLGFDDAKAEAVIIEMQSGDWGDHGVVFVTNTDGTASMCDTARGTNGWMISDTAYNYQIEDVENR